MLVRDATAAFKPEMLRAAQELNGPTFAHVVTTTVELVANLALADAAAVHWSPVPGARPPEGVRAVFHSDGLHVRARDSAAERNEQAGAPDDFNAARSHARQQARA